MTAAPTLVKIDTSRNTTEYIPLTMVGFAAKIKWTYRNCQECSPLSLLFNGQNPMIYHDNSLDPNSFFFIDLVTARMGPMAIGGVSNFSGNNPNRFMVPTSFPMTLPTWNSLVITLAALILGLFLIRGQDVVDKWRMHRWVDTRDIPGSKVTEEEVNEAAFREDQRNRRDYTVRHFQGPNRTEQGGTLQVPQSHFTGSRSDGSFRDSLLGAPISSRCRGFI